MKPRGKDTQQHAAGEASVARRQAVLDAAYKAHPARFFSGRPKPRELPETVWINKPKSETKVEVVLG